jgi:hypothetical protein
VIAESHAKARAAIQAKPPTRISKIQVFRKEIDQIWTALGKEIREFCDEYNAAGQRPILSCETNDAIVVTVTTVPETELHIEIDRSRHWFESSYTTISGGTMPMGAGFDVTSSGDLTLTLNDRSLSPEVFAFTVMEKFTTAALAWEQSGFSDRLL